MTMNLNDDQIDALVRNERPDPRRTTTSWRQSQRRALLAYMNGEGEAPGVAVAEAQWAPVHETSRTPQRWGLVAAGLMVFAGVAALTVFPDGDGGRPVSTAPPATSEPADDRTVQGVVGSAYEEATALLEPSREFYATAWAAVELVMSECMTDAGFDWIERPNEAADPASADQWQQWDDWFDSNAAADATFEGAAFGADDVEGSNVGGCQLAAFQQVYGPGVEGYAKAANLYNEALAAQLELTDALDPSDVDLDAVAEADAERWLKEHAAAIEAVRRELDEELDNARSIIDDRPEALEVPPNEGG